MKMMIFKATLIVVFTMFAGYAVFDFNSKQSNAITSIALANIEALAEYEENPCLEWVTKSCYTLFHENQYGQDYYATCGETTMGGMAECGALSYFKPMYIGAINNCLQCVRN